MRRVLALAVLLVVSACGDDDSVITATTAAPAATAAPGEAAACGPLRAIHDIDQEFSNALDSFLGPELTPASGAEFDEFRQVAGEMEPLLDTLTAYYDDAIRGSSGQLADDLATIQSGTIVLWDAIFTAINSSGSLEEFALAMQGLIQDPEVMEVAVAAGAATLRADEFTVVECGFRLSE